MLQSTQWSLVRAAGLDSPPARAALDTLCRTYRPAALAYLRASGYLPEQAEDLVQEFFARFVERRLHAVADPERGRFRVFLKVALRNFVANEVSASRAQRRDAAALETTVDVESLVDDENAGPERAFERAWTLAVIDRALRRLEQEALARGKGELFRALRKFLIESPDAEDYALLSTRLGMRKNTLAVATHRLRHRLRELVAAELMETVADPADLGPEMARMNAVGGTREDDG